MAWREQEGKPGDLQVIWWEPKYKRNRPKSGSRQSFYRGAEAISSTRRLGCLAWQLFWHGMMVTECLSPGLRISDDGQRCYHKCHTEIFLPSDLSFGVWSLPPLFFIPASCSASSSSHLTLSSFIPPCLTHLLFPLSFSPPCQLPGPLTPVSSLHSLFLFPKHPCLSLSLTEFSCYLFISLILRVPHYQTGVVYPAAICKTSLLLQVTPSGPGQEKSGRLGKQRRNETENIRLAGLDTSIQIPRESFPGAQVSIGALSPKGHSIPACLSTLFWEITLDYLGSET